MSEPEKHACVKCGGKPDGVYGGDDRLDICLTCYRSPGFLEWIEEYAAKLTTAPGAKIVPFVLVGNEKDGPLPECIPRYRAKFDPPKRQGFYPMSQWT